MKKKVLVTMQKGPTRESFFPADVRAYLEERFDVTYNDTGKGYSAADLHGILPAYDAVMTGWGSAYYDAAALDGNDRMKLIVHTGGTVGNLCGDYAYDNGVKVITGNLLYAESVAEGTLSYILMAQRRIPDYVLRMKNGGFKCDDDNWEELFGKTVGVVGLGTIAKFLIPMLKAFRCNILLYSHYDPDPVFMRENGVTRVGLDELFETADIITVHSALNAENRGLIGKEQFEKIKDGALFVNTSRGAVLDEAALIAEAQKQRFRVVLDVYSEEPPKAESPLRTLPNVYCMPHMAGPTFDRRPKITKALIDEMVRYFNGAEHLTLEITREMAKRMTKM